MVGVRVTFADEDDGTGLHGYTTLRAEDDDGIVFEANVAPDVADDLLEPLGQRVLDELVDTLQEAVHDG